MAQLTVTKIHDGARNAVYHVFIKGDGTGDLSDEVIVDPATDFDPAYPAKPTLTLDDLHYDLTGFDGSLSFNELVTGTPLWAMSGGQFAHVCLGDFGGLKDRSSPMDANGKLMLSTTGLGAGDKGVIVLQLRK